MFKIFLVLFIIAKCCQSYQLLPETPMDTKLHLALNSNEQIKPDPRGLIGIMLPVLLKKARKVVDCIKEEFVILDDFKLPAPVAVGEFLRVKNLFLKHGVSFEYEINGAEIKGAKNQVKIDFNAKWADLQLGSDYNINLDQFAGDGKIDVQLKGAEITGNAKIIINFVSLGFKILDLKVNVDAEKLKVNKFVNKDVDLTKELTKYLDKNRDDLLFITKFIIDDVTTELVKRLSNKYSQEPAFKEIHPFIEIINGKSSRALDLQRCVKMFV